MTLRKVRTIGKSEVYGRYSVATRQVSLNQNVNLLEVKEVLEYFKETFQDSYWSLLLYGPVNIVSCSVQTACKLGAKKWKLCRIELSVIVPFHEHPSILSISWIRHCWQRELCVIIIGRSISISGHFPVRLLIMRHKVSQLLHQLPMFFFY